MPIYEYKCKDCGTYIEVRQKISDEPLRTCEKCGGSLEKQWSPPAIQFKGEGWYVTDYAKKSGSSGKGEKSSDGDSTASSADASKSKDEAKSTKPSETAKKSD